MEESNLQLYVDYNLFTDIALNGQTIWQLSEFEPDFPPLMSTQDFGQTTQTVDNSDILSNKVMDNYMKTLSQSVDYLDDRQELRPIDLTDSQIHDTFASGDCQELWKMAANSQTIAQNKTQTSDLILDKKEKKFKINSLHSKSNLIRFPEKLWTIVNECNTGAIKWSANGLSICINYHSFQRQYLNDLKHFKTKNISSFVRQLNLYGFHKMGIKSKKKTNYYPSPPSAPICGNNCVLNGYNQTLSEGLLTSLTSNEELNECHEFRSEYFIRDHKELLHQIKRKYPNQPNDENSGQKSAKYERKAVKVLKANQLKTKKTKKQSPEENLNSLNNWKSGDNDRQTDNYFTYYSFSICTQNSVKVSQNVSQITDKSVETVLNDRSNDPLFH